MAVRMRSFARAVATPQHFDAVMLTGVDASSIAMRDVDWGLKIGDTLDTSSYASGNGFAISSGRISTRH
jgi:hypothetical protein